jgi:hypothetical protein
MKNLLYGKKDVTAFYQEGPDFYLIDGIAFEIDFYTATDFRLKPIQQPELDHTPFMGDGFTATIVGGVYDNCTGVTVLSRSETWAEYEMYSR